jgi:Pentose-5-phosphate-3-epimerase
MLYDDLCLSPSVMCANFNNLAEDIMALDAAGADGFHLDIMDGLFVPNYALGMGDVCCVRKNTKKPLEAHLMVMEPAAVWPLFADVGVDVMVFHGETDRHAARTLANIRSAGCSPGIAINPGTSIETVHELFPLVDLVLVMTVNPGYAGQTLLPFVEDKLQRLIRYKKEYGFRLQVDGGLKKDTIRKFSTLGVDSFVLGTANLFGHGDYKTTMPQLHKLAKAKKEE